MNCLAFNTATFVLFFISGTFINRAALYHPGQAATKQMSGAFNDLVQPKEKAIRALADAVEAALRRDNWCQAASDCNDECGYHDCDGFPGQHSELICQEELVYCCSSESGEQIVKRKLYQNDLDRQQTSCKVNCSTLKNTSFRLLNTFRPLYRTPVGTITSKGNGDSITINPSNLRRDICALKSIESNIRQAHFENELSSGIYVGTANGAFSSFPGKPFCRKNTPDPLISCDFNPTARPWYISATTGQRDIVFMLDRNVRNDTILYKSLQHSFIQLDSGDAVSLQIFDDMSSSVVQGREIKESGLTFASKTVTEELTVALNDVRLGASKPSSWAIAISNAFDTLNEAKTSRTTSNCSRFIVLVLGNEDSCFKACQSTSECSCISKIQNMIAEKRKSFSEPVSVIAFTQTRESMGVLETSNMERMESSIVCPYGIHSRVSGEDSKETAMDAFQRYAAFLRSDLGHDREQRSIFTTSRYEDAGGLGEVITVATPIYDSTSKLLVAVVGADIRLSELQESVPNETIDEQVESYNKGSRKCVKLKIDESKCKAESLRASLPGSKVCPEPNRLTSECVVFDSTIYRSIEEKLTYEDAVQSCKQEDGGGWLPIIDSEEKNIFFSSIADEDGTWIGARGSIASRELKWTSDSNSESAGQKLNYSQFPFSIEEGMDELASQNISDACVSADRSSSTSNWNINSCIRKHSVVCEIKSAEPNCLSIDEEYSRRCSVGPLHIGTCSTDQDEALKNADPLCKQSGREFSNDDRQCCQVSAAPGVIAIPLLLIISPIGAIVLVGVYFVVLMLRLFRQNRRESKKENGEQGVDEDDESSVLSEQKSTTVETTDTLGNESQYNGEPGQRIETTRVSTNK